MFALFHFHPNTVPFHIILFALQPVPIFPQLFEINLNQEHIVFLCNILDHNVAVPHLPKGIPTIDHGHLGLVPLCGW